MENKDIRNVKNMASMKSILAEKFSDECCVFKRDDINIRFYQNGYLITIKEYEHIQFKLWFETDDYFGNIVHITRLDDMQWYCDNDCLIFVDSRKIFDVKTALIELGYYIATRF